MENLLVVLHHEAFKFDIIRQGPTSFGAEYHIVLAAIHGARQAAANKIFDAESRKSRRSTDALPEWRVFAKCNAKTGRRSLFVEAVAFHSPNPPLATVGSIEGDGKIILGPQNLTVGGNDLSTKFFGMISGDDGGSLTKIGTRVFNDQNLRTRC